MIGKRTYDLASPTREQIALEAQELFQQSLAVAFTRRTDLLVRWLTHLPGVRERLCGQSYRRGVRIHASAKILLPLDIEVVREYASHSTADRDQCSFAHAIRILDGYAVHHLLVT